MFIPQSKKRRERERGEKKKRPVWYGTYGAAFRSQSRKYQAVQRWRYFFPELDKLSQAASRCETINLVENAKPMYIGFISCIKDRRQYRAERVLGEEEHQIVVYRSLVYNYGINVTEGEGKLGAMP